MRDFVSLAGEFLGIHLHWEGAGVEETARDEHGAIIVAVDPRYFRPAEVATLLGDASKARRELGWTPKTNFRTLVKEMVEEDLNSAQRDALVRKHGFSSFEQHES